MTRAQKGMCWGSWGGTKSGMPVVTKTAVLLLVLLALPACDRSTPAQKAQRALAKARQDASAGKTSRAIIEYRQAIQNDPRLAVAHSELGKLYSRNRDYLDAYRQLTTAVSQDPSNSDARLLLGHLLLAARKYSDAQEQANAVLSRQPQNTEAMLILAESLSALNKPADARQTVERLLKLNPQDAQAWFVLANLQAAANQGRDQEQSLRNAIKYDPSLVPAVAVLARVLVAQGRAPEAEAAIRDGIAKNPSSMEAQYLLAAFLLNQNRNGEAESVFRKIKTLGDKDPYSRGALARYYLAMKKPDAAEKEYQEILAQHPDDLLNRMALASMYFGTQRYGDAEKTLNQILDKHADNGEALLLRGRLRLQQNRPDDAVADFERATRATPRWALAHYYLATAQLQRQQIKLAEAELHTALELNPNLSDAHELLATIEMKTGNEKAALSDLDKVVASRPPVVKPYIERSLLMAGQGQTAEAEKDLLPLLDTFSAPADRGATYRALAWVKFDQHKYDEARQYLTRADKAEPNSRETLYLMALTYLVQRKPEVAVSLVQSRLRANPQWAEGNEVAGDVMLSAGHIPDAVTYFQKATSLNAQLSSAWIGLANALSAEAKYDDAAATLNKLLAQGGSEIAYLRLGQVQEQRRDWAQAEAAYRKVLEFDRDNVVAKNNLAWDYAEHGGNIDVALRLAQEAREAKPDDPAISDTLGWIYVKTNTLENAIELLRESVEKSPRDPQFNYHLGIAYARAGKAEQAKPILETALKLQPNSPDAAEAKKLLASLNN